MKYSIYALHPTQGHIVVAGDEPQPQIDGRVHQLRQEGCRDLYLAMDVVEPHDDATDEYGDSKEFSANVVVFCIIAFVALAVVAIVRGMVGL